MNREEYKTGRELLQKESEKREIALDEKQIGQLLFYYDMLVKTNQKMNLTAITDLQDVIRLHFIDSLAPLSFAGTKGMFRKPGSTLIDVGTGAGFPGLPLAIAIPELRVTLLDSLNKRVRFLQEVCGALSLKNVTVLAGRAEDAGRDAEMRGQYDVAVSRAVAELPVLCEYCLPFVKKGGCFLAYKGPAAEEEIRHAEQAIKMLGGTSLSSAEYDISGTERKHVLVCIHKGGETPEKYPRRAGIPAKRPL